ncbi:PolC-type DNA polymerase III [Lutibacter sp. B1]|uniref:3'-5' exonuclease n=1 Tax=Lutibacter sp. B1 TaxID=2725996 RepID=UPI0014570226|nr:3'-5' exonuclease [Lutibacter sp. B1]NLP57479.1 3'-5' exonuclease [Lutibacter sp. B1]
MISWFSHKKHPDFWKQYLKKFKKKLPKKIETTKFVVFDTETTGLDISKDRILSIGAVTVLNNTIDIAESFEIYVNQEEFTSKSVEIHGILKEGNLQKITEAEAIEKFIHFIGNSVLIAHHAAFDVEIINAALKRLNLPKLKNKYLDTGILYKKLEGKKDNHFNLDVLCNEFNIPKHDRHTAAGDAFITAQLFFKIIAKLKTERTVYYSDLFRVSDKKGLI